MIGFVLSFGKGNGYDKRVDRLAKYCKENNMRIAVYGTIIAASLWATLSFSIDYERWETAIKNSDLTFFARMQNVDKISKTELMGLLALANETVQQRQDDIRDRKMRINTSLVLKLVPSGVGQIMGFILDQRALGATLGVGSFILGMACSTGALDTLDDHSHDMFAIAISAGSADMLARRHHDMLAPAIFVLGLALTVAAVAGCTYLERWFWRKERAAYDKLEKAYQDAATIKAYLTTLAANYR